MLLEVAIMAALRLLRLPAELAAAALIFLVSRALLVLDMDLMSGILSLSGLVSAISAL